MGKRRFAGTIEAKNSVTEASRYDSEGIKGHIRGWDCGVEVTAYVNAEGIECFDVWTTGGSNNDRRKAHIVTVDTSLLV